ncbi:S-methylmethionine--homocysteine S-methyltransferase BHMT2-like [Mytilus edulis]|uniref:S-methylmethionine--homocysteine S-methyltransferase BHMT2-like n=1 Tax=Mytilus edulis TaxID=6550 RepID=UPI0039EE0412
MRWRDSGDVAIHDMSSARADKSFQYYANREKLRSIGREDELEKLNRTALKIAKKVAVRHNKLTAAGLCNTPLYVPGDDTCTAKVKEMFKEQIKWATEEKVDYIIAETFNDLGEALLALECIKEFGNGLPAVITLTPYGPDITTDDVPIPEACRRLEKAGAAVVGLNCGRGPATMLPLLRKVRKVCKGPIAALPVAFRCTEDCKTFQSLKDPKTGEYLYPVDLDSVRCNSSDFEKFTKEALEIGVTYLGICCGNCATYFRAMAEACGKTPPSSKYTYESSLSHVFGAPEGQKYTRADKIREFMLDIKKN